MDYCVDCGRRLRDLVCRSCHMIYVSTITQDMNCQNCSMQMIKRHLGSRVRYQCNFCLYNYFAMSAYDPTLDQKLNEYMNSLERPCIECGDTATINPMNKELVCKFCGLVHDAPIYTRLE